MMHVHLRRMYARQRDKEDYWEKPKDCNSKIIVTKRKPRYYSISRDRELFLKRKKETEK